MESTTMDAGGARSVDAGRGVAWWSEAWALFMKNPGMWVVFGLIVLIAYIVLAFVPFIGTLAAALLTPVFMGGWLLAIAKLEQGGSLEPADLFLGFKEHLNPLMVLGALTLAATFVISLIVGALGFGAAMGAGAGVAMQSAGGMMAAAGMGMLAMLIGLALMVPVTMALWFAPALVVFRGAAPMDAARTSFAACLRNIVPFLVFGVLYFVAAIVASIPAGLGWLVLLPLGFLTLQTTYRDIFPG
jgi:uncharacterized membrane protein